MQSDSESDSDLVPRGGRKLLLHLRNNGPTLAASRNDVKTTPVTESSSSSGGEKKKRARESEVEGKSSSRENRHDDSTDIPDKENAETNSNLKTKEKVKKGEEKKKGKPLEVSNRRARAPDEILARKKKKKIENRDPRFSEFAGNLDMDLFSKSYGFLDEYRKNEKNVLKKAAAKNPDAALVLDRMVQQDKRRLTLGKMSELKKTLNAEEREKVKEGKTPYFYSDVDIKKRLKKQEFEALKGDKEKFLAKKRQRAAQKEKKLLPARRQVPGE